MTNPLPSASEPERERAELSAEVGVPEDRLDALEAAVARLTILVGALASDEDPELWPWLLWSDLDSDTADYDY